MLRALAAPTLGHLDPQYLAIMDETCAMLREVFQTQNALTFPVSGTGMAGMECIAVNLLEPGDEVIYPNPGFPIYESLIDFLGATRVPMPLAEPGDHGMQAGGDEAGARPEVINDRRGGHAGGLRGLPELPGHGHGHHH